MFVPNNLTLKPSLLVSLTLWGFILANIMILGYLNLAWYWQSTISLVYLLAGVYCDRRWARLQSPRAIIGLSLTTSDQQPLCLTLLRKNGSRQPATILRASYFSPALCLLAVSSNEDKGHQEVVILTSHNVNCLQQYRRFRVNCRFAL